MSKENAAVEDSIVIAYLLKMAKGTDSTSNQKVDIHLPRMGTGKTGQATN